MIQQIDLKNKQVIGVKVTGKVTKDDIETLNPLIDAITKAGMKVWWYFELEDFTCYSPDGFWADLKTDIAHFHDYGKIAIVDSKHWQKILAEVTDLVMKSKVRYFEPEEKNQARMWITEDKF